MKTVFLGYIDR